MGLAFATAFALAAVVLAVLGVSTKSLGAALRVTARFSFLLVWFAYAGGALAGLFGPTFRPLARRGREFGLAFASAHLIHIGLVVWLYQVSIKPPVSEGTFIFFGIGILWTYLLALFSIQRLSQALGPKAWRIVRTIGLEYIAFAFFVDFIRNPLHGGVKSVIEYLPFSLLAVMGYMLRIAAIARRLGGTRVVAPQA